MTKIYKCPNCGAGMEFNPEKQMLVCEFCEAERSVEEMDKTEKTIPTNDHRSQEGRDDEHHEHIHDPHIQQDAEEENQEHTGFQGEEMKMYHCSSCGAEVTTDLHTIATFCSYCGSSTMIESRIHGDEHVPFIIPFKLTKEQAHEKYREWSRKGLFAPKTFKSQSTIEKLTGIYVPFWMYDYESDIRLRAKCTRIRRETRGDYEYTHTDHFDVYRDVSAFFEKIPVDASDKMDDDIMEKIEPFDYGALKDFEMPYLSGYQAERYNQTSEQLEGRAQNRANKYISELARSTIIGYSSVHIIEDRVQMNKANAEYALLPVWLLNYRYNNKNYYFTLNGQTGKIVGTIPVDKKKMIIGFFVIFLAVFLILDIIFLFV